MFRILIIEDEPELVGIYQAFLEVAGHRIVGVYSDPFEVLDRRARGASSLRPDVIVINDELADQSGQDLIPNLKASFPGARILVATAHRRSASAWLERGAHGILEEPFGVDDLEDAVDIATLHAAMPRFATHDDS